MAFILGLFIGGAIAVVVGGIFMAIMERRLDERYCELAKKHIRLQQEHIALQQQRADDGEEWKN